MLRGFSLTPCFWSYSNQSNCDSSEDVSATCMCMREWSTPVGWIVVKLVNDLLIVCCFNFSHHVNIHLNRGGIYSSSVRNNRFEGVVHYLIILLLWHFISGEGPCAVANNPYQRKPFPVFQVLTFMFCKLTSVQVTPDGKEGHVESDVSHSGVRFKDGDHSQLHEDQKHRMLPATQTLTF